MKAVILIWSYATFYPIITPILLFPIFFLGMRIFRQKLEKTNSALLFFFATFLIGIVTYINFTQGPALYTGYLEKKGVETDSVATSIVGDKAELSFTGKNGEEEKVTFSPHSWRFHPQVEEPIAVPAKGDQVRIMYYPGVESSFIILADAKKSSYGAKIACNEATRVLKLAEAGYRYAQFPGPEKHAAFKLAIENMLAWSCGSIDERERLSDILPNLK